MALALASGGKAGAQAFNGPGVVTSGSAVISTGPGSTNIAIRSSEVVIDWTGFSAGAAVNFLPANTTATFFDGVTLAGYTVLNRIQPIHAASGAPLAVPVSFNGTVQSFLNNAPGGNIWFYSPTGIIAGSGSQFNVGSLLLTT